MAINYKEYSRLRSIARKRLERAFRAGLMPEIKIPTVKEVRGSDNPEAFLNAVKSILNDASTVREIRTAKTAPKVSFPTAPAAPVQKETPEQKKARRNEQKRRSKAKRAVEKAAPTEAEGRKRAGYLKALETLGNKWREAGIDVGNWLGVMSPGMSKKFVEYIEYRFSQGDYSNKYTIDTFIRDFGELYSKGYSFEDIQQDFSVFLKQMKAVEQRFKSTKKYGISSDNVMQMWRVFVKSR